MSKKRSNNVNAKGRNKHGKFVMITSNYYTHPSWQQLSPHACRIFLELKYRYNGQNNGEISLSVREAAAICHCGKSKAQTALKELQTNGFIKVKTKGLFTYRQATTWILTTELYNNQPPSHDWKHIKTG